MANDGCANRAFIGDAAFGWVAFGGTHNGVFHFNIAGHVQQAHCGTKQTTPAEAVDSVDAAQAQVKEIEVRRQKLAALRERGIDPFHAIFPAEDADFY